MGKGVVATPKSNLQKTGNLTTVLAAFQSDGVRVDISAQDLELYRETMVLGFIWVLIRKYGKVESNEFLLIALRRICTHYGIPEAEGVNSRSFQDGLLFCAIVHSNAPHEFVFNEMRNVDARKRMNTAFQAAEKALQIPRMLEVDDVVNGNLDSDSIVTYISNFNLKLEQLPSPSMGPAPVDTTNWEALYKQESLKVTNLLKNLEESNNKIELLEVRLTNSEEAREKLEDEVESLRIALHQAAGTVVDAASEIDRLTDMHNRRIEELRLAEEEKERELVVLRQESRALEEEKSAANAKLEELNQRCLNDEKQLVDLDVSKRHLESEIEALHRRLEDKDVNQNSLVAQSEEMRSVLTGLMGQLEVVAREEQTVKTRKKGQDKERDTLASQMERLLKEKKEIEKKHEKAMKELERMKKNRDTEIKKLKKRIEDVQRASLQTMEKDKEIQKMQKALAEAQQREEERNKSQEEALRNLTASLEGAAAAKISLEEKIQRLEKEIERLEKEVARLASGDQDSALQEELARMQREHDAKLEEMRLAEEEKNKELEQLRQASKDLEDQKNLLETQLSEMNAQYANDVRSLNDLGLVKSQLDGEIEALRTRIRNQDESRNDLVVQTEEMKQVLAGLMDQLEAVNKEETIVVGRKKGRDTDRDQKNSQMEKLQKEKKEVEKANEKAQQEIERIKRNRDEEIKKLKKKMEEAQKNAGKKGGDARLVEKLKEDIRELDALLLVVREDLEKRKESGKKDEETINQLRTQLADVTQSRDNLRSMTDGNVDEKEKKWKDYEEVMTKKTSLFVRDLAHYKERKQYYKAKYRKAQNIKTEEKEKDKEKEKEQRAKERKDRKEIKRQQSTLKRERKEKEKRERILEKSESLRSEKKST